MKLRFFLHISSEGRRSILGPYGTNADLESDIAARCGTLHSIYAQTWGEANRIFNQEEWANENLR